jgi:hypothetical protein
VYNLGLDEFFEWYGREPRPGFTKATVSAWRVALEARGLGAVSINVRITPQCRQQPYLGTKRDRGVVVGPDIAEHPDATTTKGLRDRAILAVLLGCGMRRSEVAALIPGYKPTYRS